MAYALGGHCTHDSTHPVQQVKVTTFFGKRNTMTVIPLIDDILYAGISIVVIVGVVARGKGMVVGK